MENQTHPRYACPMHPEIEQDRPGHCPRCGMNLEKNQKSPPPRRGPAQAGKIKNQNSGNESHGEYYEDSKIKPASELSLWEKFKLSMSMTMGMEHAGLAGRETAKLMEEDIRNKFFFSLLFTILIVAYSPLGEKVLGLKLPSFIGVPWLLLVLTTPVYFYAGWIFLYSTYKALSQRTLNMAVLIAVGITAAYGFSLVLTFTGSSESFYEAAAMLITFVLFGHWLEMKSRRGTTDALQALFALTPPQSRVMRNGRETLVPTSEVKLNETLLLKPGDKVPVDGEIIEGETAIDESLVTGESLPVFRRIGDQVIGGSLNQTGSVKFRATKVGEDTVLSQIVRLVETAQNSKAPGQKIADRFARYLVIIAVGGGLLTFIIWFFLLGSPVMTALTFAISVVVIACPDALGLATPTAVAVGTGLGAKHNILIKDAPTLERVSKIQTVVLDKTGTVTAGRPTVTDVKTVGNVRSEELLRHTASVEALSNHPISHAILENAKEKKLDLISEISGFKSLAGQGVEAVVGGRSLLAGTAKLIESRGFDLGEIKAEIQPLLSQGKTITVVALEGRVAGVIAVADQIKPGSLAAVTGMKKLGLTVILITGDHPETAKAIAKEIGVERVFAEVLPAEKADYVKKLQAEGTFTAMVGDGINDAPALAQADIGIAIGAGTDVAVETANVVLMRSDPLDILSAIRLSKATVRKMKENLAWASVYNLFAIPIAAGLLYPRFGISLRPEFAALLMSISSVIVAVNAVLLRRVEGELIRTEDS